MRALGFRRDKRTGRIRCPKKTTFHRVVSQVDASTLQRMLLNWQRQLLGPTSDGLVVVDGKKMRHGSVEMVNATKTIPQFCI